ncbi:hypothetical protein GCM10009759_67490 [Kitasatospora saccharophila]|uniref:Uncharacterized protein n=1 Tax=Kitasatospora saccharophila TaxID=407973 RepID=A0ABN2XZ41_9ACTN
MHGAVQIGRPPGPAEAIVAVLVAVPRAALQEEHEVLEGDGAGGRDGGGGQQSVGGGQRGGSDDLCGCAPGELAAVARGAADTAQAPSEAVGVLLEGERTARRAQAKPGAGRVLGPSVAGERCGGGGDVAGAGKVKRLDVEGGGDGRGFLFGGPRWMGALGQCGG